MTTERTNCDIVITKLQG